MTEIGKLGHETAEELEKGLHLHHHLGARRERAMFATLGFVIALAVTRGITTVLHERGAGPNGGIIVGGVHIHHFIFGMVGLLALAYAWLLLFGFEDRRPRRWFRITAFVRSLLGSDPRRVRPLAQPPRRLLGSTGPGERRGPRHLRGTAALGRPHRTVRARGLASHPWTAAARPYRSRACSLTGPRPGL